VLLGVVVVISLVRDIIRSLDNSSVVYAVRCKANMLGAVGGDPWEELVEGLGAR